MNTQTQKGFSLIELLVYVGIVVIIGVIIIQSVITLVQSFNSLRVAGDINRNAISVLERTTRETRGALSINTFASTLNSSPGDLVLNIIDSSENPTTMRIYLEDNTVYIQEGSATPSALTQGNVLVNELTFTRHTTPISEAVLIEMVIEATRGRTTKEASFESGVVLRGSY